MSPNILMASEPRIPTLVAIRRGLLPGRERLWPST